MKTQKEHQENAFILVWCIGIAIALIVACSIGHASEIPKEQAIYCIIGEAENQGAQGMAGIAHALRNRGTVKGCYGLTSNRVKNRLYSSYTLVQAVKAWEDSRTGKDITKGGTGWGNARDIKAFARHKWWKRCVITANIGDHYFYREKTDNRVMQDIHNRDINRGL